MISISVQGALLSLAYSPQSTGCFLCSAPIFQPAVLNMSTVNLVVLYAACMCAANAGCNRSQWGLVLWIFNAHIICLLFLMLGICGPLFLFWSSFFPVLSILYEAFFVRWSGVLARGKGGGGRRCWYLLLVQSSFPRIRLYWWDIRPYLCQLAKWLFISSSFSSTFKICLSSILMLLGGGGGGGGGGVTLALHITASVSKLWIRAGELVGGAFCFLIPLKWLNLWRPVSKMPMRIAKLKTFCFCKIEDIEVSF